MARSTSSNSNSSSNRLRKILKFTFALRQLMPSVFHDFVVFFLIEVWFAVGCCFFSVFFFFLLNSGCSCGCVFAGFTYFGLFEQDSEFFAAAHAEAEFLD